MLTSVSAAILLFPALISSVLAFPSGQDIDRRQVDAGGADPNALPANWTLLGCFNDNDPARRTLQETTFVSSAMTPALCAQFCETSGSGGPYNFAGTEFSQECFCDFNIQGSRIKLLDSNCSFPCAGDSDQICGGSGTITIYQNMNADVGPVPSNKATVAGGWAFMGCFSDALNGQGRTLPERIDIPAGVTIESCTHQCGLAGFTTAGLEFAQECWCGDAFNSTATRTRPQSCSRACNADHTELCGAANFLSIYTLIPVIGSVSTVLPSTVVPVTSGTPSATASPSTTTVPTTSILDPTSATPSPTTVKPSTTATPTTVASSTKPTTPVSPGTTITTSAPTATIPIVIPTIIPTIIPTTLPPVITSIIPIPEPTPTPTTTFMQHHGGLPCSTCIGF